MDEGVGGFSLCVYQLLWHADCSGGMCSLFTDRRAGVLLVRLPCTQPECGTVLLCQSRLTPWSYHTARGLAPEPTWVLTTSSLVS